MKRLLGLLLVLGLLGCGLNEAQSVAALEKLGAKLTRNGQHEVIFVSLADTLATDAGVAELKKSLPNCKINK